MAVDSHTHIGARAFNKDRDAVVERAREAGITILVDVGSDLESSRMATRLAEQYDGVYAVVGYHPHNASQLTDSDLEAVAELAQHPKAVAIGEIGLDFYRNLSPRDAQFDAFEKQLELAERLGMPVVIHSRDAHEEVFSVLTRWASRAKQEAPLGVMHCFSGDNEMAQRYIDMGFFISIAGPVTYRNSQAPEIARSVPLEKVVVETDCPYLAPHPYRGRRNEPARVALVIEKIAQLRGIPRESVAEQTAENAFSLFRLG
ncbi:MAG: TatD family hydrolase [Chloroflexota bacterium]